MSTSRPAAHMGALGLGEAVEIAVREMQQLGLAETHQVGGIYAAPDARADGADFAATIVPHRSGPLGGRKGAGPRLKLLINCDGKVSVCPLARRCSRPCQAASRC